MYADPRKIKKNEVKVALVKNTGGQKAVIVRDIFMRGLKESVSFGSKERTAA